MVTRQPQVERRTAKVRLSETDVLPLSHETTTVLLAFAFLVKAVSMLFVFHFFLYSVYDLIINK